jgi:hypothetical protein
MVVTCTLFFLKGHKISPRAIGETTSLPTSLGYVTLSGVEVFTDRWTLA